VNNYRTATPEMMQAAPHLFGHAIIFNAPAFGIVALITVVLVWGIKESAGFNAVMVVIKILVLVFFVCVIASRRFARLCARTSEHLPNTIRDAQVSCVVLGVCWLILLLGFLFGRW